MTALLDPPFPLPAFPCADARVEPGRASVLMPVLVAVTDERDLDRRLAPAIGEACASGRPLHVVVAQARPGWTLDFGLLASALHRAAERLRALTASVRARVRAAGVDAVIDPLLVRGSLERAVERELASVALRRPARREGDGKET